MRLYNPPNYLLLAKRESLWWAIYYCWLSWLKCGTKLSFLLCGGDRPATTLFMRHKVASASHSTTNNIYILLAVSLLSNRTHGIVAYNTVDTIPTTRYTLCVYNQQTEHVHTYIYDSLLAAVKRSKQWNVVTSNMFLPSFLSYIDSVFLWIPPDSLSVTWNKRYGGKVLTLARLLMYSFCVFQDE